MVITGRTSLTAGYFGVMNGKVLQGRQENISRLKLWAIVSHEEKCGIYFTQWERVSGKYSITVKNIFRKILWKIIV